MNKVLEHELVAKVIDQISGIAEHFAHNRLGYSSLKEAFSKFTIESLPRCFERREPRFPLQNQNALPSYG